MIFAATGWTGTVVYVLAYAYYNLLTQPRMRLYFGANCYAGAALAASSAYYGTWQAVGINGVLGLLSLRGWVLGQQPPRWPLPKWLLPVGVGLPAALGLVALVLGRWALVAEAFGWSSVAGFVLGYLLFSMGRLTPRWFHLANGYAALVLLPELFLDSNWPVFTLESCWVLLAIWGMIREQIIARTSDQQGRPVADLSP